MTREEFEEQEQCAEFGAAMLTATKAFLEAYPDTSEKAVLSALQLLASAVAKVGANREALFELVGATRHAAGEHGDVPTGEDSESSSRNQES